MPVPGSAMSYAEYKGKLHAMWQSQLDRGVLYFTLTRGPIGVFFYSLGIACILFFRGRAYVASRNEAFWIGIAITIFGISFGSAAFNFYNLKRRVAKL